MAAQTPFELSARARMDSPERISPAQFLELLLSRRSLVRADRRHLGLRGLQDVATGELFEVEERKLLPVGLGNSSS